MVSVSKKKLKSSCVTLDAPVLMIHNAPKEKMAVWMDKEWLPDLLDQIKDTKVKVKSLAIIFFLKILYRNYHGKIL